MTGIEWAINKVGGPVVAASMCNVTPQAVRKWILRGRLPRTEYTDETSHCERLAEGCKGAFSAGWLLNNASRDIGDDPNFTPLPADTAPAEQACTDVQATLPGPKRAGQPRTATAS